MHGHQAADVLADTVGSPDKRSRTWIALTFGCYLAAALGLWPFADRQGPTIAGVTALFATAVLVAELATSFLLFARFRTTRASSMLLLACAYLFGGLMAGLHLLTFPGALLPDRPIIGGSESAGWVFILWMFCFASLTLSAIVAEVVSAGHQLPTRLSARASTWAPAATLALFACCAVVATAALDWMPPLIKDNSWTWLNNAINYTAMTLIAVGIALILLFLMDKSPIFVWLCLAMTALLFANILSLAGGGRYTLGWSFGRLSWTLSALVLFLFFMREFARQQRLLAEARAELESRVRLRTAELLQTVSQRDLLLREVYHRVKNNLQMTDALIEMEARDFDHAPTREAFATLRSRIYSLSLVHQQLMSSDNFKTFDIAPFLKVLTANLAHSFAAHERGIEICTTSESVEVDLDFAIPIGLITTELVINAVKHAGAGTVRVGFERVGRTQARLTVSSEAPAEEALTDGMGSRIVKGLSRQLDGRVDVSLNNGVRVDVLVQLSRVNHTC